MRITVLEILILLVFIIGISVSWADIYYLRDQIQTLRDEQELMILEIQNNAKLLADGDIGLHARRARIYQR